MWASVLSCLIWDAIAGDTIEEMMKGTTSRVLSKAAPELFFIEFQPVILKRGRDGRVPSSKENEGAKETMAIHLQVEIQNPEISRILTNVQRLNVFF